MKASICDRCSTLGKFVPSVSRLGFKGEFKFDLCAEHKGIIKNAKSTLEIYQIISTP
jgi:hypothetical protein